MVLSGKGVPVGVKVQDLSSHSLHNYNQLASLLNKQVSL